MRRKLVAAAALITYLLLALAASSPSEAVTSHCPPDIRGASGNCAFICFLTAIIFYRDPTTGQILYECDYGDCFSNCDPV